MQFPSVKDIAGVANDTSEDAETRAEICAAIWNAVKVPGTSTTGSLDLSELDEETLLHIIQELRNAGYQVVEGASQHITLNWNVPS